MDQMTGFVIVLVSLLVYLLPTFIGWKKRNGKAIFALNLLLGWTVLGWIIALVWALTVDSQPPQVAASVTPNPDPAIKTTIEPSKPSKVAGFIFFGLLILGILAAILSSN